MLIITSAQTASGNNMPKQSQYKNMDYKMKLAPRVITFMNNCLLFFLLSFSMVTFANVTIYKNEFSLLAYEKSDNGFITITLLGGSNDAGDSSPADCTVKLIVKKSKATLSASLLAFTTELMGYDDTSGEVAQVERDVNQVRIYFAEPLSVCPLGTEFSGGYDKIDDVTNDFKNAFISALTMNHLNALKEASRGNNERAVRYMEPYMNEALKRNIYGMAVYNDYGYFLQQAGRVKESLVFLNQVIAKNPARIVAYLNVADSYWLAGDKRQAKTNYARYKYLMLHKGQTARIPARVSQRLNEQS